MNQMNPAQGKAGERVVVITGASGGIGSALSQEFLTLGYRVAMCDKDSSSSYVQSSKSRFFRMDVRKRSDVRAAIKKITHLWKRIDVLVNNAGIRTLMPVEDYDETEFKTMWDTNFMGTLHVTLAALPFLKKSKGRIINMASVSGFGNVLTGSTFYAVSKAAIMVFTRRLALEVGEYGVRVNAIAPGVVKSNMSMMGKTGEEAEKLEKFYKSRTMLHSIGYPSDIAKIAAFLASDSSNYMTGQVVVADGGNYDYLSHAI